MIQIMTLQRNIYISLILSLKNIFKNVNVFKFILKVYIINLFIISTLIKETIIFVIFFCELNLKFI